MCEDCHVLHERLKELSGELFTFKKKYNNKFNETRRLSRENNKLRRKLLKYEQPQHYRNGQKRGKRGRNG